LIKHHYYREYAVEFKKGWSLALIIIPPFMAVTIPLT